MMIQSTRLGNVEISDKNVIEFPEGLLGFESERQFAMIEYQNNTPFLYLQSMMTPDLAFFAADPFEFFNDYQIDLEGRYEQEIGVNNENRPYIICMVSVPQGCPRDMTINLLAPVIINPASKIAKQVVLENVLYTTKHRIFPNTQTDKGGK